MAEADNLRYYKEYARVSKNCLKYQRAFWKGLFIYFREKTQHNLYNNGNKMKSRRLCIFSTILLNALIALQPVQTFWKQCDCYLDDWESWSPCQASCDKEGTQTRTRQRLDKCTKNICPALKATKRCFGGVCKRYVMFFGRNFFKFLLFSQ